MHALSRRVKPLEAEYIGLTEIAGERSSVIAFPLPIDLLKPLIQAAEPRRGD
ncbi:MAG: hypothetical protein ACT4NU_13410 [Chromatiales bacterium]